ncbi:MAG: PAC2 family protein [Acidimicrobiia bacterium]
MDPIHRIRRPVLRRPRAIIAFEGWNDACDAASGAITYLLGQHSIDEPFAVMEPDEFFDFQAHRPHVAIGDGGTRSLTWPTTRFYAVPLPNEDHDLVLVTGDEPSYRWKTFSRSITSLLSETGVEQAVFLGAFIGQVAHTKPVPVIGVATDPTLVYDHGLLTSSYEGPTGIVGVLQEACREEGLPAMSLWAATPHYLAANPNPKAMRALMKSAANVLDLAIDTSELDTVVDEFLARVAAAVSASDEFKTYVAQLEKSEEKATPPGPIDPSVTTELVSEIEAFLREQR